MSQQVLEPIEIPASSVKLTRSLVDIALVGLVQEVERTSGNSAAGTRLASEILPLVLKPLHYQFPTVDRADILYQAWWVLFLKDEPKAKDVAAAKSPSALLVSTVWWELFHAAKKQRGLDAELDAWDKESNSLVADSVLAVVPNTISDALLQMHHGRVPGIAETTVWTEFKSALEGFAWSEFFAAEVVHIVQERCVATINDEVTARAPKLTELEAALPSNIPPKMRKALVRFVLDKDGYIFGLLKGLSSEGALALPKVSHMADALVWTQPHPVPKES